VRALLDSPLPSSVERLSLRSCRLGSAGARALADWPTGGLVSLDVTANRVDDEALLGWVGAPILTRLRALACGANPFGPRVVEAFATDAGPSHLNAVDVSGSRVGTESIRLLASAPTLRGLEDIRLVACNITDDMSAFLLDGPLRDRLRVLDLGNTPITDDFVRALVVRSPPPALEWLCLRDNEDISAEGLALLETWRHEAPQLVDHVLASPPPMIEEFWRRKG
jgi:hypothetical protein